MRHLHVQLIGSLWPVVHLRLFVLSTLPPGLSRLGKALAPVGQGAGPCRVCSHTANCEAVGERLGLDRDLACLVPSTAPTPARPPAQATLSSDLSPL